MGCGESKQAMVGEEPSPPRRKSVRKQSVPQANIHQKYIVGDMIWECTYGEVRVARHRLSNMEVAVKVLEAGRGGSQNNLLSSRGTQMPPADSNIRPASPRDEPRGRSPPLVKLQKLVQNEAVMLRAVAEHPHCVQMHEFFNDSDSDTCCLVFELCKQGTVLHYLDTNPLKTALQQRHLLKEMALGVAHVHEVGIVHRNVNPDSFLVGGDDGKTIKLSDFGTATWMPKDGSLLRVVAGTAPYMSPEMILEDGYDQLTDVWSFGASCYMILYGDIPYRPRDKPQTPRNVKIAIYSENPKPTYQKARAGLLAVPQGAEDLVSACLERECAKRWSSSNVLQHAFLGEVNALAEVPEAQ